jgi:hypothetical protein
MQHHLPSHSRLRLVPTSHPFAGPQVCLAVMDDARHGILTAEWFPLSRSLDDLSRGMRALQTRGVTTRRGSLGLFDFEGVDVELIRGEPTAAELHAVHGNPPHGRH